MEELARFGDTLICPNCKPTYTQMLREGVYDILQPESMVSGGVTELRKMRDHVTSSTLVEVRHSDPGTFGREANIGGLGRRDTTTMRSNSPRWNARRNRP